jgi:hypothetical protein
LKQLKNHFLEIYFKLKFAKQFSFSIYFWKNGEKIIGLIQGFFFFPPILCYSDTGDPPEALAKFG